ncbi:folate-binding protein [Neisseria leonii]|uniref:Folate-binding protein n=1 Tax=Neisseria leonii TaxID=2995413 RepID=A0A9X4IA30_9NEIS|nr:folate-binding protein [Neisseria sp. 51.81]MDD9326964.1 folate-binding protein [Neisseria sp. 51.81]
MNRTLLPFFSLIRVSGGDAAAFLHGQLSNHIEGLAVGQACYATYNTPKGRVSANMIVLRREADFLLITAADVAENLIKRLRLFVLRAKAVFEPLPDWGVAAEWPDGLMPKPAAEPSLNFSAAFSDGLIRIALPHGGTWLAGPHESLPAYSETAEQAWQAHEILSGYPWIAAATANSSVAQMLNQHTIGGIHFKKGCYPGQEIIARAQYRGQVKRGLAVLESGQPLAAGSPVYAGDEEAGLIINSAPYKERAVHLAVIKHAAAARPLNAADCPLAVEHLFFATAIQE